MTADDRRQLRRADAAGGGPGYAVRRKGLAPGRVGRDAHRRGGQTDSAPSRSCATRRGGVAPVIGGARRRPTHDCPYLAGSDPRGGCRRIPPLPEGNGPARVSRHPGEPRRARAAPRRRRARRVLLLTLWESEEAIRRFAGEDIGRAVFYPQDESFLIETEDRVSHFEVAFQEGWESL